MSWLKTNGISFEEQDILEYPPSTRLFYHWVFDQKIPVTAFVNTHGMKYRELNMKDRLLTMSEEELIALLASHGKLVKRPILTDGREVLVGFNEERWAAALGIRAPIDQSMRK